MKKLFTMMVAAILLLSLTTCQKSKPPSYTLAATIDASTIVQGMKDATNRDYYTQDGNTPVQLTFLVYDEEGSLVYQSQTELADFFGASSFSTNLEEGNYTVVVWACTYYQSDPAWISSDNSKLSALVLRLNTDAGICAPMKPVLGVSKTSVTLNTANNINISVPTAGCFYCVCLNYASTTQASYANCLGSKEGAAYTVNSGKSDYISDPSYYMWLDKYTINTQYSGIYDCFFSLPMDQALGWKTYDANGNQLKTGQFSFTAEAGKHQIFYVNIDTGVQSSSPAINSGQYESAGMQQVFNVGTMKAEPAKVSYELLK